MGAWVRASREAIAVAERVLDHRLVRLILQVVEPVVVDDPSFGQTGEPGGGVCGSDVVADLPQVFRAYGRLILTICRQA